MAARYIIPGLILLLFSCESTLMRDFNHAMSGEDVHLATDRVERALAADPYNPEAHFLLGKILASQRKYTEAIESFDRSLSLSPVYKEEILFILESNYRSEFNSANTALADGRYANAVDHLDAASRIYSDRWEKYPLKGEAHRELGQYALARESFERCMDIPKMQRYCAVNMALAYFKEQKFDDAARMAEKHLETYPFDRNLLKIAAYANLETGDIASAEDHFSKYIDAGSTYEALLQFAIDLNNKGEIYAAERFFMLCLNVEPYDKEVLSALSSIYLETGNFDLMAEANERLLSLDPDNTEAKQRLLLAYELSGNMEGYRTLQNGNNYNE